MADPRFVKADVVRLISTLMQDKGWSAARVAREAGVAPSTITRALDPKTEFLPSARTISKIASVGVDARISIVDGLIALEAESVSATNKLGFIPRGSDIQPGHWVELTVSKNLGLTPLMIADDDLPRGGLVAFRVLGDTALPEFPDGSFVIADTANLNLYMDDVVVIRRRIDTMLDSKFETSLWKVTGDETTPILRPIGLESASAPPVAMVEGWHKKGLDLLGVVVATYARRSRSYTKPAVRSD